jgi:hypothetical protein
MPLILLGRATLFLLVYVTLAASLVTFGVHPARRLLRIVPEDYQYTGPTVLDRIAKLADQLPDIVTYALTALVAACVVNIVEKYVRRLTSA